MTFQNSCQSITAPATNTRWHVGFGNDPEAANNDAIANCLHDTPRGTSCSTLITACDVIGASPVQIGNSLNVATSSPSSGFELSKLLDLNAIRTGISFGIGILVVLLAFANCERLTNFIIHGNLPYKLPVYGEDIQVLFKRTQRVNWYGRVVFGIVANLAMTHQQLIDVRKYWLGRVIAFDSLRRQRQNELARMHLQLAASAKIRCKRQKDVLSQLLALSSITDFLFCLLLDPRPHSAFFLASFSSASPWQSWSAARSSKARIWSSSSKQRRRIEESATYLKEYLTTANTFDDRDEIYEPSDVFTPFWQSILKSTDAYRRRA